MDIFFSCKNIENFIRNKIFKYICSEYQYFVGTLELGLICFDGLESPLDLSIIFAYSWSSQNPCNVVRKIKLVETSPENT